jgi:hypothetical protein
MSLRVLVLLQQRHCITHLLGEDLCESSQLGLHVANLGLQGPAKVDVRGLLPADI